MRLATVTPVAATLGPALRSDIAAPKPTPKAPKASPSVQEATLIDRMRASETIEHIHTLNLTPRVWGTAGYETGLNYVVEQMRATGWDVQIEELTSGGWSRGKLRNIVAERRGTAPDAERKLVVAGAHLDSVRGAPGANDNASGSSTLIELAQAFEGIDTRNDIRFVWFDGEEAGLLGSRAHVAANAADTARTIAMINMDMVGSQHGVVGYDLGRNTGNAVGDAVKGVMLRTGLPARLNKERHSRSDHASFDNVGIPALDFGVSVSDVQREDPNYHSSRDTVDKINPAVLEGYGDLIAVSLLDFANRSERFA